MYAKGKGVVQDYKQAVYWYTKSAEQGYALAQYNIGMMYAKGEGVLKDYILGYMWLYIANYNGNDTATLAIKIIESDMSSTDIRTAQQMASRCVNTDYKNCGYQ